MPNPPLHPIYPPSTLYAPVPSFPAPLCPASPLPYPPCVSLPGYGVFTLMLIDAKSPSIHPTLSNLPCSLSNLLTPDNNHYNSNLTFPLAKWPEQFLRMTRGDIHTLLLLQNEDNWDVKLAASCRNALTGIVHSNCHIT